MKTSVTVWGTASRSFGVNSLRRGGRLALSGLLLATLMIGLVSSPAQADSVTDTIGVGDQPFSVAVNSDGTLAYVTSWATDSVWVIDLSDNTVLTPTIAVGDGPYSVAVDPTDTFAYVANYDDDSVSVIDLSDNTVLTPTIAVGDGPYSVAVNPAGL